MDGFIRRMQGTDCMTPDPHSGDAEVQEIFESFAASIPTDEMGHIVCTDSQESMLGSEVFGSAAAGASDESAFARPAPISAYGSPHDDGSVSNTTPRVRPVSRTMRTTMHRLRQNPSAGPSPVFSPRPESSPSPSDRVVTPSLSLSLSTSQPYSAEKSATTARRIRRKSSVTENLAEQLEGTHFAGRNSAKVFDEDVAEPVMNRRLMPKRRHTFQEQAHSSSGLSPDVFSRSDSEPVRSPSMHSPGMSSPSMAFFGANYVPHILPMYAPLIEEREVAPALDNESAIPQSSFMLSASSSASSHSASFSTTAPTSSSSSAPFNTSAPSSSSRPTCMDIDTSVRSASATATGQSSRPSSRVRPDFRVRSLSFDALESATVSAPSAVLTTVSSTTTTTSSSSSSSAAPMHSRGAFAPLHRPSHLSRQQSLPSQSAEALPSITVHNDVIEDFEGLTSEDIFMMHDAAPAHVASMPSHFSGASSAASFPMSSASFTSTASSSSSSSSSSMLMHSRPGFGAAPSLFTALGSSPLGGLVPNQLPLPNTTHSTGKGAQKQRSEGALRDSTNLGSSERRHKPKLSRSISDQTAGRTPDHPLVRPLPSSVESSCQPLDMRGDGQAKCALPVTMNMHRVSGEIRCISPQTLARLVRGEFNNMFDNYVIVDCRYPFEFDGGHIQDAVNFWTMERVLDKFFLNPILDFTKGERNALIFHCEFSAKRGPTQYMFLREVDRMLNQGTNELLYPEVYLLEGGFCNMFDSFPELSSTGSYVRMDDKRFEEELVLYENILNKSEESAKARRWISSDSLQALKVRIQQNGLLGLFQVPPASPMAHHALHHFTAPSPRTPFSQTLNG